MRVTPSESPFFSIVIPTNNSAKELAKALESVASQTFASFEVRLIDNASTDATKEIAAAYCQRDPRFIWLSESDKGIYDAMNKGISAAHGSWVFFLGSDDYFFSPDVLETVHKEIATTPDVQLVYGNVWLSRPLLPGLDTCLYGREHSGDSLLHRNICHQSMFYQRALFNQFGLYKIAYPVFADWDFNHRIFHRIQSRYIVKTIAYHSLDGLSGTKPQTDVLYGRDLLENMATRYSYSYKHHFFNHKKKQLLALLLKLASSGNLLDAAKLVRVLLYQLLGQNRQENSSRPEPVTTQLQGADVSH